MKKSYMKNLFSNFKNVFLKSYLKKTVIMDHGPGVPLNFFPLCGPRVPLTTDLFILSHTGDFQITMYRMKYLQ
jgi:hypothetical protein